MDILPSVRGGALTGGSLCDNRIEVFKQMPKDTCSNSSQVLTNYLAGFPYSQVACQKPAWIALAASSISRGERPLPCCHCAASSRRLPGHYPSDLPLASFGHITSRFFILNVLDVLPALGTPSAKALAPNGRINTEARERGYW
eukprot:854825-Amphidinium_carterae.1